MCIAPNNYNPVGYMLSIDRKFANYERADTTERIIVLLSFLVE